PLAAGQRIQTRAVHPHQAPVPAHHHHRNPGRGYPRPIKKLVVMKRSKQQKLLRRLLLHYINFYPPESMSDLSGTVTAVMVLIELLAEEKEPGAVEDV